MNELSSERKDRTEKEKNSIKLFIFRRRYNTAAAAAAAVAIQFDSCEINFSSHSPLIHRISEQ
jgi:hypothetical protein